MNISFIHTEPRYSLTHLSRESRNSFIYSRQLTYFINPETFLILFILLLHTSSTSTHRYIFHPNPPPSHPLAFHLPLIHSLSTSSTIFPPHPQFSHLIHNHSTATTSSPTHPQSSQPHPKPLHLIHSWSTSSTDPSPPLIQNIPFTHPSSPTFNRHPSLVHQTIQSQDTEPYYPKGSLFQGWIFSATHIRGGPVGWYFGWRSIGLYIPKGRCRNACTFRWGFHMWFCMWLSEVTGVYFVVYIFRVNDVKRMY